MYSVWSAKFGPQTRADSTLMLVALPWQVWQEAGFKEIPVDQLDQQMSSSRL